ncbi:peptidoglycan-binding protein [Streptomyces sp. NPDC090080]|uniref:peptidoglycan-binding domain-containing protein n=1 Tax=Streptomyces sp. NPDC090080 TaxID=3365939 RepID=UPI00381AB00E
MAARRSIAAALLATGLMTGLTVTASPASASVAAPATVYSCNKTYYSGSALTEKGDTGTRVIEVQCQLHYRGFLSAGGVDGIFGNGTYNAVLAFQREYRSICNSGLSIDGVVGTYTWAALRSACPS